jgi:transposase
MPVLTERPEMPHGKSPVLMLSADERRQLLANVNAGEGKGPLAERSRMILLAADGLNNRQVASRLAVRAATVGKWRQRFLARRLAGLADERRGGRPRVIDEAKVQAVVAATLAIKADGGALWSTRSMAKRMGMSQSAISRIWRAHGLTRVCRLPTDVPRKLFFKPKKALLGLEEQLLGDQSLLDEGKVRLRVRNVPLSRLSRRRRVM